MRDAETGQGVGGAAVSWGAHSTTTDSAGNYSFTNLPCESQTLSVSKTWYEDYSATYSPTCNTSNLKDIDLRFNTPASGTTVITHGFELPLASFPSWTYRLAEAIRDHAAHGGTGRILRYIKDTGELALCLSPTCSPGAAGPETVIVFDWEDDSNDPGEGFSEAAAEALFAALVEGSRADPPTVNLSALHLIGHSRGTVVNSEVAERLIAAGFPPPLQVTTLDPHDWGGYGPLSTTPPDDGDLASRSSLASQPQPLEIGHEDFDVNEEHAYQCGAGVPSDPSGVCAWEGVGFNDNYFQEGSIGLDGRRIRGAANLDLSSFEGAGINDIGHEDVHNWYHCTVDPTTTSAPCDPGWFENEAGPCADLPTSGDPAARTDTFAAEADGFFFSRLGGGEAARCPEEGESQRVEFDFALQEGLVNGDFEKKGSGGAVIPGWSYHGGGGSAVAFTPVDNNYLELSPGQQRTHNRTFVPWNASGVHYCWRVSTGGSPETFQVVLKGSGGDEVIDQLLLASATNWVCTVAPVPEADRGQVRRLEVELTDSGSFSAIVVDVDDVKFALSGPCTYSLAPDNRVHTAVASTGNTISVNTRSDCAWSTLSDAGWITVTGGSTGTGSGTVTYSVGENTSTGERRGTITIGDQAFDVIQEGASCTYALSPTSRDHGPSAAFGQTVSVTAPTGCSWDASTNVTWMTITAGVPGDGDGTVTYAIDQNPGLAQRTGTLTIAGETFTVTQSGAGSIEVIESSSPFGYVSLASLGATPFECPSLACDNTGWEISGLDFYWLGKHYDTVRWITNGYIYLQSGDTATPDNQDLPDPLDPDNVLAPFWTDLDLDGGDGIGGGTWYLADVTDGVRTWHVFEWENAQEWNLPSTSHTFQIWIELGTSNIWFVYGDSTTGAPASLTIGAEDGTGSDGHSYYYNGSGTLPEPGSALKVLAPGYCSGAENLTVSSQIIGEQAHFEACNTITGGPDLSIVYPADVTFSAGGKIVLENGFRVGEGAKFTAISESTSSPSSSLSLARVYGLANVRKEIRGD